jgi:sporulation protein YlmC with PRC-barrel domain
MTGLSRHWIVGWQSIALRLFLTVATGQFTLSRFVPKNLGHGGTNSSLKRWFCMGEQTFRRYAPMKRSLTVLAAGALLASSAAFAVSAARADVMTTVPSSSLTVTDWYKQDVYDQSNTKIGQIKDVLVGQDGQVSALIVGVGGFLGAGEKDVAVSFNTVKATKKDNKIYLTMNTTKDALKAAPGFKYDRDKTAWVPDTSSR